MYDFHPKYWPKHVDAAGRRQCELFQQELAKEIHES
jgi:hypothetical protein